MVKKTYTYTDYNGNERTETHYFDLNESEVIEIEMLTDGGLVDTIKRITDEKHSRELYLFFKDFVLKTYGKKSPDGTLFLKDDKIRHEFSCSIPYNMLVKELITDTQAAIDFFNGVIPKGSLKPKTEFACDLLSAGFTIFGFRKPSSCHRSIYIFVYFSKVVF